MAVSCIVQGGWGNRFFMISQCVAHALRHNLEYCIPKTVINPHYPDEVPYLFPNINYCDKPPILTHYSEAGYRYQEVPRIDNVVFMGYWQSWKYFHDYRDEIIKLFGFDDIKTSADVCSLHYRSTDYKNHPTIHPIVSREYLRDAAFMMYANGYRKFLVFSDDIPEIRDIIESFRWGDTVVFEYSEGESEMEDLRAMASCSSNIIANSTFSWWGAYFNPNKHKTVIAPKRWFGPDMPHSTDDLIMPDWIKL